jgi:hypothetical protein
MIMARSRPTTDVVDRIRTSARDLYGEIVFWSCVNMTVRFAQVERSLDAAGLDTKVLRGMLPRNAFARACHELEENRIIRKLAEDPNTLVFQFTKEVREEDGFRYDPEAKLELDKKTGTVTCAANKALAAQAQKLVDEAMDNRTGSDITALVQRLFRKNADLFPARESGGVYFVPVEHADFVAKVEAFFKEIGGKLERWPIAKGDARSDVSVKDAVTNGLRAMIEEQQAAVEAFDPTEVTKRSTNHAAEKLKRIRTKITAYAEYLADEKARLEAELAKAGAELKRKIAAMADAGEATAA